MIRIALSGDRGRMGQSLQKLIGKSLKLKFVAGANKETSPFTWQASHIDGIIDFSLPELFIQSLKWSVEYKKPFVSGTTGLSYAHKRALKRASQSIPVFYGENMSGGIFVLSQCLQNLFYDTDVLIEDIHHEDKKDKPSGTALKLAGCLPPFLKKRLKINSFRKGKVFGTHRVLIKTGEETLTLEHKALSRKLFAKGALQALLLILKKKKGYYGPSDLYTQRKLPSLF